MLIRTEIKHLERLEVCVVAMYQFDYSVNRFPMDKRWPERFAGFSVKRTFFVPVFE